MSKAAASARRPHVSEGGLPADLEALRTRVNVNPESLSGTNSHLAPDTYDAFGLENDFRLADFRKNFRVQVQHVERKGATAVDPITGKSIVSDSDRIVFDMIGIEAPLANALRRILLAEVPTMAIERVVLFQNTSIIQDEVLAHRLGLIPICVDPRLFQFVRESARDPEQRRRARNPKANDDKSITVTQHPAGQPNELNTLVFVLDVKCTRKTDKNGRPVGDDKADVDKYENYLVHSRQLQWIPQGQQAARFSKPGTQPRPYYDDIVIAKLRPGQSIEAELHVEKGLGQQHAKWSPVATASYRLMPEVLFPAPVVDAHADELKRKCPMNVFDVADIEDLLPATPAAAHARAGLETKDLAGVKAKGARRVATAARPRNCTMCRECTRGDTRVPSVLSASAAADPTASVPWSDLVKLRRVRDHFIFSVETTGAYSPTQVVREAIGVLKEKALTLKRLVKGEQAGPDAGDAAAEDDDEDDDEEDEE